MEQNRKDPEKINGETEQEHSMVCNDQLFFAELRIAAEEAEREQSDKENK